MIEFQIMIPALPTGSTMDESYALYALGTHLTCVFGAFRVLTDEQAVAWRQSRVYRAGISAVYVVSIDSIADAGKVAETAVVAKWLFKQDKVFVRYLGLEEAF